MKHTHADHETGHGVDEEPRFQLETVLKKMPHEVPIFLVADPGINEAFGQAATQLVRILSDHTSKITMHEYDIGHRKARKFDIKYSPTLVFDPDNYRIRWLGGPLGEEGRTFVEAIIMLGYRNSGLSPESIKILDRIQGPRDVKVFVSPTCPYCPQQAVNALKAAVQKPDAVSVEIIDIQANPGIADDYGVNSVPQVFANEVLVAQGAQTEELFMLSLDKMEQQTVFIPEIDADLVENDLVIVGGGPAGLTAGIYAVRSGLNTAIIEKEALGGQMATTPVIENYPGFTSVGGKSLVDIMVSHALEYVQIFQGEEVLNIEAGNKISVLTSRRKFLTRAVLLATGASHKHLGAAGEDRFAGRGVSYCSTCDGPLFKDKKVVIVGGGDSAVTEALHLHHIGVDVTLIHRKDTLRAQEHLTKGLFDDNIPVIWNTEVKEIKGREKVEEILIYDNQSEQTQTMKTDGVFISIGYTPQVELAKKIGAEITPEGYIKHDSRHRTNISGIYCAGDVEGGYKQIVIAAGQGSEAAISIFEDLVHPYWTREKK